MFGQFFERLNNRLRKPEEPQKEGSPFSVKPSGKDHSPNHHLNLTTGASNLQASLYNHRALQPPITSISDDISKFIDQKKMRNPSPICPKTLQDEQETLHSTTPRGNKTTLNTGLGIRSKGIFQGENYKRLPDFGGRQVQKEPVKNHKESILQDSIKEGSFLAQSIPGSKLTTASKCNNLAEKVGVGVRPKLMGGGMAQRECKTIEDERFDHGDNDNRLQQAWQGWWNEKKKNSAVLLEASKTNQIEICWQLLDKNKGDLKADMNYKGENGWTPLHFACLNGNIDLVNLFLYNGAHTDAETTLKYTVLHLAAQKGHVEVFKLLINSGANINATDIFNNTPLHYAAQNGSKSIVEILISRPSLNLSIKNNDNQLASELAQTWEIRQLFEAFMFERKLLNSKTNKISGVQAIKPIKKKKMFEIVNKDFNEAKERDVKRNVGPMRPPVRKTEDSEFDERRVFSHRSNITGDTKANSSLNTTESDNGNVSAEEEKIGPQSFKVHGLIGKGSFGEVYLVEKKTTGIKYAMKVLHKSMVNKHNLINYAMTERNVLGVTNHSFIVKLNFAFQTPEKLFLILDYCPGGDLSEHLQREKRFSEEKARIYIAEVILALEDLHKRDIIFRDLKPDNIVLDADGHIKLTDFGLSKEGVLDPSNGAHSFCGSVAYLAPEMLRRTGHGKAVDWYLLGVVFYEMLVGIPPYYANNRDQLFYNIDKAPLKVPSHLSSEAKSLLKGLLQRNPARRLGSGKTDAEEIKTHEFFKNIDWKDVAQKKITPPLVEKKINFIDKVTYDVFEMDPSVPEDAGKIEGWSFVATHVDQSLDKRLF